MSPDSKNYKKDKSSSKQPSPKRAVERIEILTEQPALPATVGQRARIEPGSLSSRDVLQLQTLIGNQAIGKLLTRPRTEGGDLVQRVGLQGEGEKASNFWLWPEKRRKKLANELMDGNKNIMPMMDGVCYDAVAVIWYLLGKIKLDKLKETSGEGWIAQFNFTGGKQWDGKDIAKGTAVGFYRVNEKKFFHAAIAVGETNIRGVNGLKLGAGWIDIHNLKNELTGSVGNWEYDGTSIQVWLKN
jgi:hypothetical protein